MRSFRTLSCVLLLAVTTLQIAAAQTQTDIAARLAAIENAVDAKREELHIPGISLVIVKDDKVIYSKGLGLRNVEENLPVSPKTQFAIGSSSKAFTAMTVMMSADDGKLSLTDSPKKYLPYFKINDKEIDSKITISDILSHRSGLERTDMAWFTGKLSPREIIEVAGVAKPTAKLGEKFQYQNVMFLAAGEVVAAVQKKPWRRVVADRIFKPLGMKTTNTDVIDMQRQPDFATGYEWNETKKSYLALPAKQISFIAPAGAINSNADEMSHWLRFMLNGGVYEGKRLVSEKNFAELTAPRITMAPKASYGYGWMLRDWNGHKIVEHGGNITGFNAQVALMPDQKLGFVLLTNVSASSLGSFTMDTVWDNLVGGAAKPAAVVASGPPTDPDKEVGKYKIRAAPVVLDVSMNDAKLVLTVAGQPPYPLVPLGGRHYKLGSPAPEGFFVTFRPTKDKPDATELFLEQPGVKVTALREESGSFKAPLTVDELMQKVADARGGEANLRKHKTIAIRYDFIAESQGVSGHEWEQWRATGAHSDETTLIAVGKKIGWVRECYDGKEGSTEISFAISSMKSGKSLANASAEACFAPELDWKRLYKSVTITRLDKVDGEECYVVEKTVDKGDRFVDYISTKTFLSLKSEGAGGGSETYKDYRDVGGIKISFERVRVSGGGMGTVKVTVKQVRLDAKISDSAFRPRISDSAKTATTEPTHFTEYD